MPVRGERWNAGLLYALAALAAASQGSMELTFPLNLHHIGFALPLIGIAVGVMGVGQILSRLPGGHWYQRRSAPKFNAVFLAAHGMTTIGLALTSFWVLQATFAGLHGVAFGLVTTFQLAMLIDNRTRDGSMAGSVAWYTAALSVGYAAGAPLGALSIEHFGYAGAFWISGGITFCAAGVSLLAVAPQQHVETSTAVPQGWRGFLLGIAGLPASIWLAALLALYLNFITDSVASFFPIYAVAVGIPLGFIGLLRGLNSLTGAAIRIAAAGLFRVVRPHPANHVAAVAMAVAAFTLSFVTGSVPLLLTFLVFGASRGLIRVTSTTFVADERSRLGPRIGLASGVYNAGLDAGAMLAPPVTGVLAAVTSIPVAFRAVSIGLPLLYYAVWLFVRTRRQARTIHAESLDV